MSKMLKGILFIVTLSIFITTGLTYAQDSLSECRVYMGDYNNYLCKIPGAQKACSEPRYLNIVFPGRKSCEEYIQRKCPAYDFRCRQMVRCECTQKPQKRKEVYQAPSSSPQYDAELRAYINETLEILPPKDRERLLWSLKDQSSPIYIKIICDAFRHSVETKAYESILREEEALQKEKIKKAKEDLIKNKRIVIVSSPPMTPERLKKVLTQAYCAAYWSIQAAKREVFSNVITGNLETDLEKVRDEASKGFDKEGSPCPPIPLSIPEVGDPAFKNLSEAITQFNQISNKARELNQQIKEKKNTLKEVEKKHKDIEQRIKVQEQIGASDEDLLRQAQELLKKSEQEKKEAEKLNEELNNLESSFNQIIHNLKG